MVVFLFFMELKYLLKFFNLVLFLVKGYERVFFIFFLSICKVVLCILYKINIDLVFLVIFVYFIL